MKDLLSETERAATDAAHDLRLLHPYGLRRTLTGYYYIAHYYPLRAMDAVDGAHAKSLVAPVAGEPCETYVHFPFCEIACSFCHFYKEVGRADLASGQDDFLDALETEFKLYTAILGRVQARSFYVGGGTPSLIKPRNLSRLLAMASRYLDISHRAELKFELFPKHYARGELSELLTILRDFGFTDIVIDLESGNHDSLRYVGRNPSSLEAYLELVERCVEHGFTSIVTGLIIGLPFETFDTLAHTIGVLAEIPEVQVVNTFPLITRPPDRIHQKLLRFPNDFQSTESRDALWIFARALLRGAGFSEGPISYWRRPGKRSEQQADKFECVNLLGFGPSGFGYINGQNWAAQYFNVCNLREYYRRISARELPLWRAGILDQSERSRRKLIFGLANCKTESLTEIQARFHTSIDDILGPELNALVELGLIEVVPNREGIRYTEKGLCRLEEISYFLGSAFVRDRCEAPVPDTPDRLELLRHHYYITIPAEDRRAFENFASIQSPQFMARLARPRTPEIAVARRAMWGRNEEESTTGQG
jgi:oxygen-independent coproporphyrinogen-3 oxidase